MILKNLRLTNFKNHVNSQFDFGDGINCILGKNGKGKTNLLDAIYYLSFTKSSLSSQDRLSINHNKEAFTIFGAYDKTTIAIHYEKGKNKVAKLDGSEPEKLSDIIGKVPLVIVLPDDTGMIKEGSEERRKFFDGALCQFDREYLNNLLWYSKLLKQRNSLLKQQRIDRQLLSTYDDLLIPLAIKISKRRNDLVKRFLPFLQKNYRELHEGLEVPSIQFKTHIFENFETAFKAGLQKDIMMQRTLLGSHKDDFEFELNGDPLKMFGSQGQQKTFVIALKLALFDFLTEQTAQIPLLILDDIFDKLDDNRINLLVSLLKNEQRFGQIFITDARKDRSRELFSEEEVNFIEIA